MSNEFKILATNYNARIKDTGYINRYYIRPVTVSIYENLPMDDYLHPYSERVFSVEIPESELARLENDLNSLSEVRNVGPYQYRSNMDNEIMLRRTNKSVKKAYDHYRMILRLAAEGNINNTD